MSRSVSSFEKLRKLGEGTYGTVYQAKDKTSGQLVALKRLKIGAEGFEREGMPVTSLREVALLRRLRHPNIVRLLEVAVGSKLDSVFLVFEYCAHDLGKLVDAMPAAFSPAEVKCLLQQLLSAAAHLHACAVLHRDLKLSNLLLTDDGTLKLCDFGLARTFDPPKGEYTGRVVTLWYRAPELLFGAREYGAAVDMWAAGCIMGELLLHRPLMPASTELKQLELMVELLGTPNERIWPEFSKLPLAKSVSLQNQPYNELPSVFASKRLSKETLSLLDAMLTYDPDKRITAESAIAHAYFRQQPLPQRRAFLSQTIRSEQLARASSGSGRGAQHSHHHHRHRSHHQHHGAQNQHQHAEAAKRTACAHSMAEEGQSSASLSSDAPRKRARQAATHDDGSPCDSPTAAPPSHTAASAYPPLAAQARLPSPASIFATAHRQL